MEQDDELLVDVLNMCGITPPKQRRSFETFHRVLRATQQCICEHGYSNTSTQEIARRADISHGGLFTRFPTKVSIAVAMVGYLEGQARKAAARQSAGSSLPTGARARAELFVKNFWHFVQTPEYKAIDEVWEASRYDTQLLAALRPMIIADVHAADLAFYFPEIPNGPEIEFLSQIVYAALEFLDFNQGAGADDQAPVKLDFVTDLVCRELAVLAAKAET